MTAGELRREFLLRIIRHTINGRGVNCRGGLSLNDDLKRLVAEGKVKLSRIRGMGRTQMTDRKRSRLGSLGRMTLAQPSDGIYSQGYIDCPCCGATAPDPWLFKHADSCSLRTDHYLDRFGRRSSAYWHNKNWMGKPNRP